MGYFALFRFYFHPQHSLIAIWGWKTCARQDCLVWLAVHLSARIFDTERSLSGLVWKVVFLICYSIWYWLSYTYNSSVTKRVISSSIMIGCANAGFKMRVKGFAWLSASHLCLFGAFSGLLRLFLWLYIHFLGFGFGFLEGAISGIIHGRYQKRVSSFLGPFLCELKEIQVCCFCYLLCIC